QKLAADTAELGLHPTETQLSGLLEQLNQLRRKIAAWIETQTLFMPEAAQERARAAQKGGVDGSAGVKVYNIPLWLPLALLEKGLKVGLELQQYEWKLREGQAHDSLEEVRHFLRL
ncbi:hypothetical protein C0991_010870, partial [Blastosporella zonata]